MKKNIFDQFPNEIYSMVDEKYISQFDKAHQAFMKEQYYNYYLAFCHANNRKPLGFAQFFSNMHRRRIKIYQLCCPYCGSTVMMIHDNRVMGKGGFNYCPHCGRGSVLENMVKNFYYYTSMHSFHKTSINMITKDDPTTNLDFEKRNCARVELIELVTIIEVTLKEYFDALLNLNNISVTESYINKLIQKSLGNDFMNIEKANEHFKKAFNIDIKKLLPVCIWNDFVDIVHIRNIMIHKNGRVDKRFKATPTYMIVKKYVDGDYYLLKFEDVDYYYESIVRGLIDITNNFLSYYYSSRSRVIANYYFNKPIEIISD